MKQTSVTQTYFKQAILMPLDHNIRTCLEPYERARFLTFKSQLKNKLFNSTLTFKLSLKRV